MRATSVVRVIAALGSCAMLAACALFSSLDDLEGSDAATSDSAPIDDGGTQNDSASAFPDAGPPPATGFNLAILPGHVTEDPGDSFPIDVAISRAASFTDAVTIVVNGLPTGATVSTLVIPGTASTGTFSLAWATGSTITNADVGLTVVGTNGTGAFSASAPLAMRLGSLLLPNTDAGVYEIPSYETLILAKAWGAGGGAGGSYLGTYSLGGAGGFATAMLPVTPGESLAFHTGTGGLGGNAGGGGGGGFSWIQRGSTYLLIAGGGGGGGDSTAGSTPGGAGGGSSGQMGGGIFIKIDGGMGAGTSTTGGFGGSQTAGGAAGATYIDASVSVPAGGNPGTALQGGTGSNGGAFAGGNAGGGNGTNLGGCIDKGCGGGAGGGGWFGGGSGADESGDTTLQTGGGGGSAYVDLSGKADASLLGGVGAVPARTTDIDYAAGVASGGNGVGNASSGRIVIRLSKP